jgi:hypothetical protein
MNVSSDDGSRANFYDDACLVTENKAKEKVKNAMSYLNDTPKSHIFRFMLFRNVVNLRTVLFWLRTGKLGGYCEQVTDLRLPNDTENFLTR